MDADQRVFLAYRAIFGGQNALIRRGPPIKKLISQHKSSQQPLLKSLGTEKVVETLKSLLSDRVFESELEAKLKFPQLYETTPAQERQHREFEADAARSEAEALDDVASVEDDPRHQEAVIAEVQDDDDAAPSQDGKLAPTGALSLYPVYFPYPTQHMIFTRAQKLLEQCCYDFSARWLPDMLIQKGWDCPEAIELNKWAFYVMHQHWKLPTHCFASGAKPSIVQKLKSVVNIRHAAVHRLRTTVTGILGMLQSAIDFSHALKDQACEERFTALFAEVEQKKKALELNKNFLESKLQQELDEVARLRKELDVREQQAAVTAIRNDNENIQHIGDLLAESVRYIFDNVKSDKPPLHEANDDSEIEPGTAQSYDVVETDSGGLSSDEAIEHSRGSKESEGQPTPLRNSSNSRRQVNKNDILVKFPPPESFDSSNSKSCVSYNDQEPSKTSKVLNSENLAILEDTEGDQLIEGERLVDGEEVVDEEETANGGEAVENEELTEGDEIMAGEEVLDEKEAMNNKEVAKRQEAVEIEGVLEREAVDGGVGVLTGEEAVNGRVMKEEQIPKAEEVIEGMGVVKEEESGTCGTI